MDPKRTLISLGLTAILAALPAFPALAADDCCPPTTAAGAAATSPHAGMDMGGGGTVKVHEGKKSGYAFAFEAISLTIAGATHHLMVSITDPAGKAVTGAKVGFDVVGPDKKDQKVMAMAMGRGYGGNLNLPVKGKYTVKTRFVGGGADLLYEWTWEIK